MADKYLTSSSFADAKELWNSTSRSYLSRLQRLLLVSLPIDDPQRTELNSTGFFKQYNSFSCDWSGYTCYRCDDSSPSLSNLCDAVVASTVATPFFWMNMDTPDTCITNLASQINTWTDDSYTPVAGVSLPSACLYPYFDHYTDTKDVLLKRCIELIELQTGGTNISNFHVWVCAGTGDAGGDIFNPTQNSVSISDVIGMTKIFMSLGGVTLSLWNLENGSQHAYWSGLVGYEEMQQYSDVVKNGTNFKPVQNRKYSGTVTSYNNKDTFFYDVGNDNLFVTCRHTDDDLLFCGFSCDGTSGNVTVPDPFGTDRTVNFSPYGQITLIRRSEMGYGPVVLSNIATSDVVSPAAPTIVSIAQISNTIVRVTLAMPVSDFGGGVLSGLTKLTVATIAGTTAFTGKTMTEILAIAGVAKVDVTLTPADAGQQKVVDVPVTNLGGQQSIAAACSDV